MSTTKEQAKADIRQAIESHDGMLPGYASAVTGWLFDPAEPPAYPYLREHLWALLSDYARILRKGGGLPKWHATVRVQVPEHWTEKQIRAEVRTALATTSALHDVLILDVLPAEES